MTKKIHLGWFTEYGPIGWDAQDATEGDWRGPDMYQEMARICERGMFDFALFADHLGITSSFGDSIDNYIKHGLNGINHDATLLCSMVAAATNHLGVGTTVSTMLTPPYLQARQTASLDHLTKGRVAWNVVTTGNIAGFLNFGVEQPEHDARYDIADEYLELCFKLWGSWAPDAVQMDRAGGVFADPDKVKPIHHEGRYFKSRGPLNVVSSPQGRPTIIQAGSSERGKTFAARWADAVIVGAHYLDDMKAYYEEMKQRVADQGRDPAQFKVFFIVKPVLGQTEADVQRKLAALEDPPESAIFTALAALSSRMNYDLSQFNLDEPLPQIDERQIKGGQTTLSRFYTAGRKPTLREVAKQEAAGNKGGITGTPEQVADQMQHIMETVGGDGFVIRVNVHERAYMQEFVDTVVPLLQQRGLMRTVYNGTTLRDNLMEY
ncbi:NtaA/DmoA family FMN-dependent monooxygenase [Paenibacillus sp. IB182496]|uniref:NtaA/DmoA family FMN-dependent monooxygenase n=1 Tax=Paenibacillus sabuli TaxID=2772509 RepID=A0A927BQS6_9BACL|nr:NtaA/DmoA family FMN-dependent monooxygenase [Paenibacillus sabuli]MBD2843985.1 NtaA/DmoA family FMN-dependent monooxygenase [Paenibacillus sabuli]